MSVSWHAFLFGGLDPSGGVSVDKPPVDLWFQVGAVKLFGYNPTALKVPQALAGTLAVPLLYDLVRRPFGRGVGLGAAAALAVMPVAVMTARSDTMDTLMVFMLLAAAWMTVRAIERDRLGWLLGAGALLGLAFNVKLFQALLPLPALMLLWLVGSQRPLGRRIAGGAAALLVAAVVAFAWIVPVALTPASQRPYPIGSTNGSVWNLVFVFNGLDRLHGRALTTPDTLPPGSHVSSAIVASQKRRANHLSVSAAPERLFGRRFAQRIGTELFPALLALLGAAIVTLVAWFRRRRRGAHAPEATALGLCIAAWTLTGYLLFSAMGSFHPRYFEAITPAVAAALGGGLCLLVLRGGRLGRGVAAVITVAAGIYAHVAGPSRQAALVACVVAALVLIAVTVRGRPGLTVRALAAGLALAAVLIAPASASWTVVHTRASDAEHSGAMPASWPPLINRYLRKHGGHTRYSFASVAPAKAAPLIADNPAPVLMLTSYHSRPLITVPELAALVHGGQARYFLIGRRCESALTKLTAACPATARWAIRHSSDVTRAVGIGHRGLLYRINYCSSRRHPRKPAPALGRGRNATPSAPSRSAPIASRASRATCVQSP
jgi:4-amino-4-deoxy-L-arabinose transferase-like glycosyltransferase